MYTAWKNQKVISFLVFSGSKKQKHWPEINFYFIELIAVNSKLKGSLPLVKKFQMKR